MFKLKVRYNGAEYKELLLTQDREYIVGRSPECDLVLGEKSGISRQHFRLYVTELGAWHIQVLSKFGTVVLNGAAVSEAELTPDSIFKIPPYDFFFVRNEEERSSPAKLQVVSASTSRAEPVIEEPVAPEPVDADENEHTRVGSVEMTGYLRVSIDGTSKASDEELLRLEGTTWIAGRDESCTIFLNHATASRRQFRIDLKNESYSIVDLGSSNGTMLNGNRLQQNEPIPLRSGDVIQIKNIKIQFEMRDPSYKNRLTQIPRDMMAPPHLPVMPSYSNSGYNGGVIKIQGPGSLDAPLPDFNAPPKSNKKVMIIATALAILFLGYMFMSSDEKPKQAPTSQQSAAMAKLTPAQKQLIKDSYNLAKSLVIQGKYELASEQLKKIHDTLPEGYQDSKKMAEDCDEARKFQQRAEELRQEKERLEQIRKKVAEVLQRCSAVSMRSTSVDEIKSCLGEAQELDPDNAQINTLIERVQKRADEEASKAAQRKTYVGKLGKTRVMFNKAQALERSGQLLQAIDEYEHFIKAALSDQGDLKSQAEQAVARIRTQISGDIEKHLAEADSLHKGGNLRGALGEIAKTKKIDPENQHAAEMGTLIARELNAQLQEIYSNSVLDEGLGNIDAAKEKWRKILELDRVDGDYYRRARNKLRTYGAL